MFLVGDPELNLHLPLESWETAVQECVAAYPINIRSCRENTTVKVRPPSPPQLEVVEIEELPGYSQRCFKSLFLQTAFCTEGL